MAIDINIATPNLQEVTDSGNKTNNDIEFNSGVGVLLKNTSRLKEGTIDSGAGGGIAQICAVGYELKWEAGSQYVMTGDGLQIREVNHKFNTIPTSTNDKMEGFYVGSRWILDNGDVYVCTDWTPNAAVWEIVPNADWNATSGSTAIANKPTISSGTVTSVGLTMPSAFTVANSPITSSGDIAVTGAGVASQYVRGDGSLANFPTTSGGGASVSYYLNGSVSQGTFGGIAMREINKVPIIGTGTDFTINANGYIQSFITDANDPNQLEIPAGNWNFETYFSSSSSGGNPSFYVELYKWNGATLSLIASNSTNPEIITGGTAIDLYLSALAVPQTTLALTDRLVVRIYVTPSGRTIKLHTEDNHLSQIITTFSTGLTSLNGITAQVQNLAVGQSGSVVNWSSVGSTHTLNIPIKYTIELVAALTVDFYAPYNLSIDSITNILNAPTITIQDDGAAYTLGNTIAIGSKVTVTASIASVVTLNVTRL